MRDVSPTSHNNTETGDVQSNTVAWAICRTPGRDMTGDMAAEAKLNVVPVEFYAGTAQALIEQQKPMDKAGGDFQILPTDQGCHQPRDRFAASQDGKRFRVGQCLER